jgi:LuxR family quorum sensing-dependent transcriptional regulator
MTGSSLSLALDMLGKFEDAANSEAAGSAFFDAVQPLGVRALVARSSPTRAIHIATESLAKQQHVYARISPSGWEDAYVRARLDRGSPLIRGAQTRAESFVWSDIFPSRESEWTGWKILGDFNFENGIGVPCHGPGGYCAVISMGFERIDLSPRERRAIDLACVALHDQMKELSPAPADVYQTLTERERDALAFVAEGKSDWEISVILGIAQATAHSHVENAKRKLGAKTRAQAVARAARLGLI